MSLPYLLAEPQLQSPFDAYSEGMSRMTTTGASVLIDIPALDHSVAMWRQFTQWLGGMWIIILALAVLPRLWVGGRQLMEYTAGALVIGIASVARISTSAFDAIAASATTLGRFSSRERTGAGSPRALRLRYRRPRQRRED